MVRWIPPRQEYPGGHLGQEQAKAERPAIAGGYPNRGIGRSGDTSDTPIRPTRAPPATIPLQARAGSFHPVTNRPTARPKSAQNPLPSTTRTPRVAATITALTLCLPSFAQ